MKKNKTKSIFPKLYNTSERPIIVNEYSVWIPLVEEECQIYIDGKWRKFERIVREKYDDNNNKRANKKDKLNKFVEALYDLMEVEEK